MKKVKVYQSPRIKKIVQCNFVKKLVFTQNKHMSSNGEIPGIHSSAHITQTGSNKHL